MHSTGSDLCKTSSSLFLTPSQKLRQRTELLTNPAEVPCLNCRNVISTGHRILVEKKAALQSLYTQGIIVNSAPGGPQALQVSSFCKESGAPGAIDAALQRNSPAGLMLNCTAKYFFIVREGCRLSPDVRNWTHFPARAFSSCITLPAAASFFFPSLSEKEAEKENWMFSVL